MRLDTLKCDPNYFVVRPNENVVRSRIRATAKKILVEAYVDCLFFPISFSAENSHLHCWLLYAVHKTDCQDCHRLSSFVVFQLHNVVFPDPGQMTNVHMWLKSPIGQSLTTPRGLASASRKTHPSVILPFAYVIALHTQVTQRKI